MKIQGGHGPLPLAADAHTFAPRTGAEPQFWCGTEMSVDLELDLKSRIYSTIFMELDLD